MRSDLTCFVCPATHRPLTIDAEHQVLRAAGGDPAYAIVEGIIDFTGREQRPVRAAYDKVSPVYDAFLTSASPLTALYNKVVWGLNDEAYVKRLLEMFSAPRGGGIIIDIPVGTGVFTADLYARLHPDVTVIAMDYSMGMLRQAKALYESRGIGNIVYACADVARLPLADGCADSVLSMNGYHAFPEKDRALAELARVMKPGADLLGCFYVRGERLLTDGFVRHVYARQGTFTPPFPTVAGLRETWGRYFTFASLATLKSIVWFKAMRGASGTHA